MVENTLYHHGIMGMHWGIRRYQPYGSGGYNPKGDIKKLNKITSDKNYVKLRDRRNMASITSGYAKNAYERSKADNDKVGKEKYGNLYKDLKNEIKDLTVDLKPYQNDINKIIKNVDKNGYEIGSKQVTDLKKVGARCLAVGAAAGVSGAVVTLITHNPFAGVGTAAGTLTTLSSQTDHTNMKKTKYYAKKKEN